MSDVLLLDSRDSFTFNLAQAFGELGASVEVVDVDDASATLVQDAAPKLLCVGPGPRGPRDLPTLTELVTALDGALPIFGVCLGMQVIVRARGGRVGRARAPIHGKRSPITPGGDGIFSGLPSPLWAMRYHSLVAVEVPASLSVTALCPQNQPMALAAKDAPTLGVQFHPESIGTSGGLKLLGNVLRWVKIPVTAVATRAGGIPPAHFAGPRCQPGRLDAPSRL